LPWKKQADEADLNLIEWWNANKNNFLKLAFLARKWLCIPATSVYQVKDCSQPVEVL
jgi:hypothetical protein